MLATSSDTIAVTANPAPRIPQKSGQKSELKNIGTPARN
jgi:hypothetical protein